MNTALVTGANKGIGLEVARQLGSMGFHVFLGARNSENGQNATQALRKTRAMATFVSLDVSDPESIRNAVQLVSAAADHLDVLVTTPASSSRETARLLSLIRKPLPRPSKPTPLGRCL